MSENKTDMSTTMISRQSESGSDGELGRRTLRAVLLLVTACVLFVGTLSAVAVFVTSRLTPAAESGSAAPTSHAPAKKPLSI